MITDEVLSVIYGIGRLVLGVFPTWTPPSFFSDLHGYAVTLGNQAAGFNNWVPISLGGTVVGAVAVLFGLVSTARFALWLWSKLPVVGS